MTGPFSDGGAVAVSHPPENELRAFADRRLVAVAAWSVEAHLASCLECLGVLSAFADGERLARNRSVLLAAAAVASPGPTRRVLGRLGVPEYLLVLLAATPSLRRSWLLSVLGVLGVITGESLLVHRAWHPAPGHPVHEWGVLVPFLLLAPLLVLGSVVLSFLPSFDPSHRVAAAAPFPGVSLLLLRAISAVVVPLIPVVVVALILPGPIWLPAALLLPCLAVASVALAAATVVGPNAAVVAGAAVWVLPLVLTAVAHPTLTVVQWHGQIAWAVLAGVMVAVAYARRDRFEMGWL